MKTAPSCRSSGPSVDDMKPRRWHLVPRGGGYASLPAPPPFELVSTIRCLAAGIAAASISALATLQIVKARGQIGDLTISAHQAVQRRDTLDILDDAWRVGV